MSSFRRLVLVAMAGCVLTACVTEPTPPRPLTGRTGSNTAIRRAAPQSQAGVASEPALGVDSPQEQVMSELTQRLDSIASELRELRNDSERNTHDLDAIKTREREMYLDLDRRMQALEGSGGRKSSQSEPPIFSDNSASSQRMPPLPAASAASQPPRVVASIPTQAPTASLPVTGAVQDGGELTTYNDAFNQLKAGQYPAAISGFKKFLSAYPQSAYSGNAQYWLAEANYVNKDYPNAVTEFSRVVDGYPQSSKVPDAKLKLGFAYFEMGDWQKSRSLLEDVRDRYPGSTVARLADQRLTRMSQEGH